VIVDASATWIVEDDDAGTRCSSVTLSVVGTFTQRVGQAATFDAHAINQTRSAVELWWSASNGELSAERGSQATYTCSKEGTETLTISATWDADCATEIAQTIVCKAPE
jgi:hypothetical protein